MFLCVLYCCLGLLFCLFIHAYVNWLITLTIELNFSKPLMWRLNSYILYILNYIFLFLIKKKKKILLLHFGTFGLLLLDGGWFIFPYWSIHLKKKVYIPRFIDTNIISAYVVDIDPLLSTNEEVYHISVIPTQYLFWYFLSNK